MNSEDSPHILKECSAPPDILTAACPVSKGTALVCTGAHAFHSAGWHDTILLLLRRWELAPPSLTVG